MTATQAKRPPFFAPKFCRLMEAVGLANEIGAAGCWLLTLIVNREDATGYRGPVDYYNGQLLKPLGLGSVDTLDRVRRKVAEAGWLEYTPGGRGKPGLYRVTYPDRYAGIIRTGADDKGLNIRTHADDSPPDGGLFRTGAEVSAELLSLLPNKDTPSECGTATAASTSGEKKSGKPKKTQKGGKPPGPHQQAVSAFGEAWQAKYGVKYPFDGGKDGKAIAWLLDQVGGDVGRFRDAVARYFDDSDQFYAKSRHSLGLLRSQFHRWLTAGPATAVKLSRPPLYPDQCTTL